MWVYIEDGERWLVGFYDPSSQFHVDSSHTKQEKAAERAHYLNGGEKPVTHVTPPDYCPECGLDGPLMLPGNFPPLPGELEYYKCPICGRWQ